MSKRIQRNKNLSLSSKKGNGIGDILVIFLVLFLLAIIGIVMYNVTSVVHDEVTFTSTEATEAINDLYDTQPSLFDGMFVSILVLFWIGSVVLAFFIDSHPGFFVLSFVLLIILVFIGAVMSNTFEEFSDEFGYSAQFPMTTFFFDLNRIFAF